MEFRPFCGVLVGMTQKLLIGFANRRRPSGDSAYPQALCTAKSDDEHSFLRLHIHTPTQVCALGSDGKGLASSASDTRTHMHTRTRTHTNAQALVHTHEHARLLQI